MRLELKPKDSQVAHWQTLHEKQKYRSWKRDIYFRISVKPNPRSAWEGASSISSPSPGFLGVFLRLRLLAPCMRIVLPLVEPFTSSAASKQAYSPSRATWVCKPELEFSGGNQMEVHITLKFKLRLFSCFMHSLFGIAYRH